MAPRLSFKGYSFRTWAEKNISEILKVFATIEILLTILVTKGIFDMATLTIVGIGAGTVTIKWLFDAVHYFFADTEKKE